MTLPSIYDVLDQELQQVETSRKLRLDENPQRLPAGRSLIGLAFSGGGIRSATFNLGVLQALARKKLLRSIDYISTVSGGGYIGGWLMGWMHHQGVGIREIEERLSTPPKMPAQANDPPEVHFLRDYSNYLTPRKGLLRPDFLAFAASYLRNTLLNQIILVLALLGILMIPRTLVYVLHRLEALESPSLASSQWWRLPLTQSHYFAMALAMLLGVVAVVSIGLNLETVDPRKGKRDYPSATATGVQFLILLPLTASAAFFAYGCSRLLTAWKIVEQPAYRAPALGVALYLGMWVIACGVRLIARRLRQTSKNGGPSCGLVLLTALFSGAIIGYLFVPFAHLLIYDFDKGGKPYSDWYVMTFGPPSVIGIMQIAGLLHIGLMGRKMTEAYREWWGRLGGLLMLYALGWLAVFLIAVYFPYELGQLIGWENSHSSHIVSIWGVRLHLIPVGGIFSWILSTAYGVFFGKSEKTSKWNPEAPFGKKVLSLAAKLTPSIFVLGVVLALSVLASYIANFVRGLHRTAYSVPSSDNFSFYVPALFLMFIGAAVLFSWRVDINEFSIHYLYRDRLIRCYLGASVPNRAAQPFTGFSDGDNFPLGQLAIPLESHDPADARPIPLFNASLNVVRGKELAMQTRKARSFALTPLFSGFTRARQNAREWDAMYARTKLLASKLPGFKDGITVGTAIAISGAAASPNMGSYSDPALGFLMTLFDVRLGWWVGNPTREKCWKNGSPTFGFYCLIQELLGTTNDDSDYVYLSDGGHFENLAIYELVRRRCKLIIASDASCDSACSFGDLHNAVERCRTDFGVEIMLDKLDSLKPQASSADAQLLRSRTHFVTGKIRYNPDAPEDDGTIIYLKPALVEGDPDDVLAYALKNKCFPNDTTANQWFDEAHFENYRALGLASANAAAEQITSAIRRLLH